MTRFVLLAALLIAIMPLTAGSQEGNEAPGVYVALGDSIAAGVGSSLPRERSYPSLLRSYMESHLGRDVALENLAEPGATAESLQSGEQLRRLGEIAAETSALEPEVLAVTVTIGGNEILEQQDVPTAERETDLANFSANLRELATAIRATVGDDTPVAITTIYDPTGSIGTNDFSDGWWIERYNEVIRSTARDHGFLVADLAGWTGTWADELTRYPVDPHPTNEGHRVIAGIVWGSLGIDDAPPVIEIESSSSSTRLTPTLRFNVSEPVSSGSVAVSSEAELTIFPPVQVSETEFVALLRLDDPAAETIDVRVDVRDLAGNAASLDHTLNFDLAP